MLNGKVNVDWGDGLPMHDQVFLSSDVGKHSNVLLDIGMGQIFDIVVNLFMAS